jgi:enoyl-CoA hydratase/carnithine racemase
MGGRIRAEKDGAIGWLVFDQPERRNAVSAEMWRQIPPALADFEAADAIRVIVMRGAGDLAFIAGADVSEFEHNRTGTATQDYDADAGRALLRLAALDKPLLAQIRGFCFGGGVAIALCADLRYAAEDAVFAIPAARLGLGYHMGGLEALASVVGAPAAKEIFFTARRFSAQEALHMRLVNAVLPVQELEARVRETAGQIAANAPLTVRSVKLILGEIAKEPAQRDIQAVNASIRACFESQDYREGVRAFLEKRRPDFRGH